MRFGSFFQNPVTFVNSPDPYMALMSYRATPQPFCNLSPAELSMGRQIHTDVPQMKTAQIPNWFYLDNFRMQDEKFKAEQKYNYDKRHRVRQLPSLPDNTPVWVTTSNRNVPEELCDKLILQDPILLTHNLAKFAGTGVNFVFHHNTLKLYHHSQQIRLIIRL